LEPGIPEVSAPWPGKGGMSLGMPNSLGITLHFKLGLSFYGFPRDWASSKNTTTSKAISWELVARPKKKTWKVAQKSFFFFFSFFFCPGIF
jgi:hypothetical protein